MEGVSLPWLLDPVRSRGPSLGALGPWVWGPWVWGRLLCPAGLSRAGAPRDCRCRQLLGGPVCFPSSALPLDSASTGAGSWGWFQDIISKSPSSIIMIEIVMIEPALCLLMMQLLVHS